MTTTVQIVMDEGDFRLLTHNAAKWAGEDDWEVQTGRFEIQGRPETLPSLHWKMAYWVGSEYTTVILAMSFLAAQGFESQPVVDLASDCEWVILTDYDDWEGTR